MSEGRKPFVCNEMCEGFSGQIYVMVCYRERPVPPGRLPGPNIWILRASGEERKVKGPTLAQNKPARMGDPNLSYESIDGAVVKGLPACQTAVKRVGLAALVVQTPLGQFPGEGIQHGDLLIARVKIAAYNQHWSAPFFRASVVSATKFTRRREPTPSSGQPTLILC